MGNEVKTQWHPAFCSAVRLELRKDAHNLIITNEYNINSKPLEMDMLIIKKKKDVEVQNQIGKIFRKHNIIEYKSPDDSLNLNTYLKVVAYALLYKVGEEHVDEIGLNDITITLIREHKPVKLLKWFRENEYTITEPFPGILYVLKEKYFPVQILISENISKEELKWLSLLSHNLEEEDMRRAVLQAGEMENNADKEYADSILQVVIKENSDIYRKLKGDVDCSEVIKPYFSIGYPAELFDAPCNNLGNNEKLVWTAYTYLVDPPSRMNRNEMKFLAGFSWGYTESFTGVENILDFEILGESDWEMHRQYI